MNNITYNEAQLPRDIRMDLLQTEKGDTIAIAETVVPWQLDKIHRSSCLHWIENFTVLSFYQIEILT